MATTSPIKPKTGIEAFPCLHTVIPSKNDSTAKKVAKVAIAILTAGISLLLGAIAELVSLSGKGIYNACSKKDKKEKEVELVETAKEPVFEEAEISTEKPTVSEKAENVAKPFWTPAKKIAAVGVGATAAILAGSIAYDQVYLDGENSAAVLAALDGWKNEAMTKLNDAYKTSETFTRESFEAAKTSIENFYNETVQYVKENSPTMESLKNHFNSFNNDYLKPMYSTFTEEDGAVRKFVTETFDSFMKLFSQAKPTQRPAHGGFGPCQFESVKGWSSREIAENNCVSQA